MADVTDDSLRVELEHEGDVLFGMLQPSLFAISRKDKSPSVESNNQGFYMKLCSLQNGCVIQLWYDYSSGGDEPMFWVGLKAPDEKTLTLANDSASETVRAHFSYKVGEGAISSDNLKYTVVENYGKNGEFYLGRYFSDYSAEAALDYLKALLGTNESSGLAWEGEVRQRMTTYFERDAAARARCVSKPEGDRCVVCEMRFADRYGSPLGVGYIHVHHTTPLSARRERSRTTDDSLVSVCPNCHAMLHRYQLKTPDELRKLMRDAPEWKQGQGNENL